MRQFITFTIDTAGNAAVIAHPRDSDAVHKAAAEKSALLAYRAATTDCKRVSRGKPAPAPKPAPAKR